MATAIGARVASSRQLCGFCRNPVVKHVGSVEEKVPGQPPRLFHAKKCWPKEKRRRHKLGREERRKAERAAAVLSRGGHEGLAEEILEQAAAPLMADLIGAMETRFSQHEDLNPSPLPEPSPTPKPLPKEEPVVVAPKPRYEKPVPPIMKDVTDPRVMSRAQGKRGLGVAITEILESTQGYFTKEQVMVELAKRKLTTTMDTVRQYIYEYGKQYRPYTLLRVRGRNVYRFDAPGEGLPPILRTCQLCSADLSEYGQESEICAACELELNRVIPEPEPVSAPEPEPEPAVSEPEPVSVVLERAPDPLDRSTAPSATLMMDRLDRELNDFQVMVLDMVSQLRSDLKRIFQN